MKKRWIIGIIAIAILIGVIYMLFFQKNVEIKKINHFSFYYSTGNMMYANVEYKLDLKDDKYIAEIKPTGIPDDESLIIEVDDEFEKNLEQILLKYQVNKWNGFKKSDKHVLDGGSFSLYVRMDEETIDASGYMKWPKNYNEVKNELNNLFMNIYNNK